MAVCIRMDLCDYYIFMGDDGGVMVKGEAVRLSSLYNPALETKEDRLPGNKYEDVL